MRDVGPKKRCEFPPVTDADIDRELEAEGWPAFDEPTPPAGIFKTTKSPASEGELAGLVAGSGGLLPASYLAFLRQSNGAEDCAGDEGGECLALWSAGEIGGLNEAYGIPRYAPEFLAIGSDGGGDAVGFDRAASLDPEKWPDVRIGFGNLDRRDLAKLAGGFQEWWQRGFPLKYIGWCCDGG